MFIRILLSLSFIGLLLVPQRVFAEKFTCNEMRNRCLSVAESQYKECVEECNETDFEPGCDFDASIAGYKKGSSKYYECLERAAKLCKKEICERDYHETLGFCSDCYKQCRKGDVFGSVTMDISYVDDACSSLFSTGNASFTILGFWKYQPKESYGGMKNYRPDNLQMLARFKENTLVHNEDCPTLSPHCHGCPTLISYFNGGKGAILTVDPNVDIPSNPFGRLVIYDFPLKIVMPKNIPKPAPSKILPLYRVGHTGTVINIVGKEREDRDCPCVINSNCLCPEYGPANYKVRFGQFLISDDLKPDREMSGSESWESCGDAISETRGENLEQEASIHFEVLKDSFQKRPVYSPQKKSQCPPGNTKSNIRVRWKFNLIE